MRWLSLGFAAGVLGLLMAPGLAGAYDGEVDLSSGWGRNGSGRVMVASPDRVAEEVGQVTYDVMCPEQRDNLDIPTSARAYQQRMVKITLGKPGLAYRDMAITSVLLDTALGRALAECPVTMWTYDGPRDQGNVGRAEIYAAPAAGERVRLVAYATSFASVVGYWQTVIDAYAEDQNAEAKSKSEADAAAAKEAGRQTEQQAQLAAEQLQQQQAAVQAENDRAASAKFWAEVRLAGLVLLLGWLWSCRETLLAWYYALKPHPASDLVYARVNGGGPIDGPLFAEVMRAVPGGRVEQQVRAEQARRLAAMARAAAESRLAELERMKAKALREAEYIHAQDELRASVEAHELAMARLDAVRNWGKRHGG